MPQSHGCLRFNIRKSKILDVLADGSVEFEDAKIDEGHDRCRIEQLCRRAYLKERIGRDRQPLLPVAVTYRKFPQALSVVECHLGANDSELRGDVSQQLSQNPVLHAIRSYSIALDDLLQAIEIFQHAIFASL